MGIRNEMEIMLNRFMADISGVSLASYHCSVNGTVCGPIKSQPISVFNVPRCKYPQLYEMMYILGRVCKSRSCGCFRDEGYALCMNQQNIYCKLKLLLKVDI